MDLTLSNFEQITVSEGIFLMILPSLYQKDLGIVSDTLYRLSFDTEITSGVLKVYQGSQLIYASGVVMLGLDRNLYESVVVTERIRPDIQVRVDLNDSIAISENMVLSIPLPVNVSDSVTITENFAKS